MKADLTRRTHDRDKHYARVIHQQGRVPLDADLNEQHELQAHLGALESVATIGPVGVPKGDSFKVTVAPGGRDLLVAPGLLFVDGIVCEPDGGEVTATMTSPNIVQLPALTLGGRPLAPADWVELASATKSGVFRVRAIDRAQRRVTLGPTDDVQAALGVGPYRFRRRSTYVVQPDLLRPDGTTFPAPANPDSLSEAELPVTAATLAAGAYQVYLEVWRRHITALEDPALREVALGGPDTTTRAKTVWQLRLRNLGAVGTVGCDLAPVPAPGTLRARARRPGDGSNPCIIAPGASYRRLENQLYRVEIHTGGAIAGGTGPATFKFSRDNGSVVVGWLGSTATTLSVASTGPDRALGLESGQWVELIDDQLELAGLPGTLVQIDGVVANTITMKAGTATGTTAFADFRGNPRLRRWDMVSGVLDVERDDTVNDGYLELEDGVQVRFDDGDYRTGAHWTIPARTITADVEWPRDADGEPISRPPEGIVRHRAPLGVFNWDGTAWSPAPGGADDCRTQFPPLTHICAEDVCVHDDPCGMGVTNVQEAIEKLCSQQDLPFHNQHLHGWGVVCGLQVNCLDVISEVPDPREKVVIRTGYAIHPTGVDIKVDEEIVYPVVDEIVAAGLAVPDPASGQLPDTAVSLWIDKDRSLHLEAYDPNKKTTITDLLEGTILLDFYHHCIEPVVDFFKGQVTPQPGEKDDVVSPTRKRLTTLINLIWQFIDKKSGQFIYLSGEVDDAAEGPNHEDKILRDFFNGLRALLQSDTFCAMFDDVVFPEYDVYRTGFEPTTVPHPSTIFGKNSHKRLRVHPTRMLAMSCGNGSKINVYDLAAGVMVAEVEFPLAGAEVQDVAFAGTNEVFATAWIGDAKADSAVVGGTIGTGGAITWTQNQVTCAKKIVTLQTASTVPGKLFAAARGGGIFVFDAAALDPNPPRIGTEAKVTGHMVMSTRSTGTALYYAFNTTDTNPVAYDRVTRVAISSDGTAGAMQTYTLPVTQVLSGFGHDDIAVTQYDPADANPIPSQLWVVAEGTQGLQKSLLVFDGQTAGAPQRVVGLGENTENRLAFNPLTKQVFITFEDTFRGQQYSAYDPQTPTLQRDRHPLQIGPISVAAGDQGRHWYVLNWMSSTITVIPATYPGLALEPWESVIVEAKLAAYRNAVIVAFLKMIGRFLQYLKDCFCHLLLVDCPDPKGKKVYLADVSVKNGVVYQICNFSRRKYVHTFPTVEYWMSIVPVIPLVKKGVEKFCCSILTGYFDGLKAPDPAKGDMFSVTLIRSATEWVNSVNLKGTYNTTRSQVGFAGALGKTMLTEKLARPPAGTPPSTTEGAAKLELVGRDVETVRAAAEARGVNVTRVTTTDTATALRTLASTAFSSARVAPGTDLELVADPTGRVLGYRRAAASDVSGESPGVSRVASEDASTHASVDDVARLTRELGELRAELEALRAAMPTR